MPRTRLPLRTHDARVKSRLRVFDATFEAVHAPSPRTLPVRARSQSARRFCRTSGSCSSVLLSDATVQTRWPTFRAQLAASCTRTRTRTHIYNPNVLIRSIKGAGSKNELRNLSNPVLKITNQTLLDQALPFSLLFLRWKVGKKSKSLKSRGRH